MTFFLANVAAPAAEGFRAIPWEKAPLAVALYILASVLKDVVRAQIPRKFVGDRKESPCIVQPSDLDMVRRTHEIVAARLGEGGSIDRARERQDVHLERLSNAQVRIAASLDLAGKRDEDIARILAELVRRECPNGKSIGGRP